MLKAVIDTSVFISGLISTNGSPRRIIDAMNNNSFIPVVSADTLKELTEVVIRAKFHTKINKQEATTLIENIHRNAILIRPLDPLKGASADPKDDRFLAAAFAVRANCIVSLDSHLLDLKIFRGIPIIRPKEFIKLLSA